MTMHKTSRIVLALLAGGCLLAWFGIVGEATGQTDDKQPPAERESQADRETPRSSSAEEKKDNEEKAPATSPTPFTPSEEVPVDMAVDFPVDI